MKAIITLLSLFLITIDICISNLLSNVLREVQKIDRPSNINLLNDQTYTALKRPSLESIRRNIYYSAAIQCDDFELESWSCYSCQFVPDTKLIKIFSSLPLFTKGFLAIDQLEKSFILSFRAPENIVNFLSDALVVQVPFDIIPDNAVAVHYGILLSIESLADQFLFELRKKINDPEFKDYKIKVMGHSFGGAMASLAAIKIKYKLNLPWSRIEVYTYGQPRVGNTAFAHWYNRQTLTMARVTNYDDVVSRLPPRLTDYSHHGNELILERKANDKKKARYCDGSYLEDPDCLARYSDFDVNLFNHLTYFDFPMSKLNGACTKPNQEKTTN